MKSPLQEGAAVQQASCETASIIPPAPLPIDVVHYSRGRDKYDAYPEQRTAATFAAFVDAVLSDRSTAKGLIWISAPFAQNGDGRHHRCRDGVLPRRFLAFDLDGGTREAAAELGFYFCGYSGFWYTTSSHTAETPHLRYILELTRPVDRAGGIRLGAAMQRQVEARLGALKLDPSVYRADQPVFGPLRNADVGFYGGDPVDVDKVLKDAPPLEERAGRAERAAAIASDDPVVRALTDRGAIKRDHGDGKLSIACPFKAQHTEPGGESSTVYFLPNFGGVRYGKFGCLHRHCEGRQQEDFLTALGLAPREVWREQAFGAAPYDDLPPVGSYDAAAQEGARRHTEGAKGPAEDEPRLGNGAAEDQSHVILTRGDTMPVKPIRWTWDGYLARSKLHVLAGAIGTGKSTIAIDFAAVVTTGGQWPDGTKCDPGDVLVWSDEDDPEDTLLPRFLAAGGDPRRIHFVTGTVDRDGKRHFDPATDIPELDCRGAEHHGSGTGDRGSRGDGGSWRQP